MRALAFAVALVVSGCASSAHEPVRLGPASAPLSADDYEDVLARWSREEKVFQGLQSILFARATMLAPEMKQALAAKYPEASTAGDPDYVKVVTSDEGWQFFFAPSVSSAKWNDFHRDNSIWTISLRVDDAEPVAPVIDKVRIDANLKIIYPYLNPYSNGYTLVFPTTREDGTPTIPDSSQKVVLRVASALGASEMTWALAR